MAYERKFEKVDLSSTVIVTGDYTPGAAWKAAKDHVDMDIVVTPIKVNHPDYEPVGGTTVFKAVPSNNDAAIMDGRYLTESGRDGQFFMVMVDRMKDGNWKSLTPCSDYYAAVAPRDIYENLQELLDGCKAQPVSCYNAYNGGSQILSVRVDELKGIAVDTVDDVIMEIVLKTSLDKSSNHVMTLRPMTKDGKPIPFSDTGRNGLFFKVRHTSGGKDKITDFNAAIASIAANWNERIVPYIRFISQELTEGELFALLSSAIDESGLPKELTKEIQSVAKLSSKNGGLEALAEIGSAVEASGDSPMSTQQNVEKVTKAITNRVKVLFAKHLKEI